jgi:hypothetical protein
LARSLLRALFSRRRGVRGALRELFPVRGLRLRGREGRLDLLLQMLELLVEGLTRLKLPQQLLETLPELLRDLGLLPRLLGNEQLLR